MATEHDDFVLFVRAGNFRDGVVGGRAFGIFPVLDVHTQSNGSAVREQARDAAIILIAHHERRNGPGRIVGGVLLGDDDAVSAAGVVDADESARIHEELINFARDFRAS